MELNDYLKFFFALLFVLSLMGGLAFLLKKFGYGQGGTFQNGKRRLKILETLPLSPKQKAVLIQRDDQEHLVILGHSGDTVVETNIQKTSDKAGSNDQKD